MSERDLQSAVIDLAHLYTWRVAHFRAALTKRGWRTPVQADGAGFPDLLMIRGERLVVAELKASYGKTTQTQIDWLRAFEAVAEMYLWTPASWESGSILEVLRA